MANRRTSYQRIDEIMDRTSVRNSRVDQGKLSFIPLPRRQFGSLDRLSGLSQIDYNPQSATRGVARLTLQRMRNRSVDSARKTLIRPHSSVFHPYETPSRTPMMDNSMKTPMSAASICQRRAPSNERSKNFWVVFEKALSAAPPAKDKRPITDVNWQRATGQEVLRKLRENEKTSLLLPSGGAPLKPIAIRLFINLTNALLEQFAGDRFHVESVNYIEKLPIFARKLMYPGVMAKSWLKTVNTVHTYPHVLAFLSYMVDLLDVKNFIKENMSEETLYGTNDDGILYSMRHRFYFKAWSAFQDQNFHIDDFQIINDEYINELKIHFNVSDKEFEDLKAEVENRQAQHEELLNQRSKIEEKRHNLLSEITSFKNRAERIREMDIELKGQIHSGKNDIEKEKRTLECVENSIEELQNEIISLQKQVNEQKMSIKNRDEILKHTNYLNECFNNKNTLLMDLQKTLFQKDIELAAEQRNALKACMIVNKYLMEVGLAMGNDLSCFSINERNLLHKETLENLKTTIEKLNILKLGAEKHLLEARHEKDSENKHKQQLHHEIDSYQESTNKLEVAHSELVSDIKSKKANLNLLKKCVEDLSLKLKKSEEANDDLRKTFEDKKKDLDYWKEQEIQWKSSLDKMNKETELLHDSCQKTADNIIKKYLEWANSLIPDIPRSK